MVKAALVQEPKAVGQAKESVAEEEESIAEVEEVVVRSGRGGSGVGGTSS